MHHLCAVFQWLLCPEVPSCLLQVFSNNMSKKTEPKITSCKPGDNWTSITFKPDLAKFGMTTLENDVVMLMRKRVFDMAGVLGKTVKARQPYSFALACSINTLKPGLLDVKL